MIGDESMKASFSVFRSRNGVIVLELIKIVYCILILHQKNTHTHNLGNEPLLPPKKNLKQALRFGETKNPMESCTILLSPKIYTMEREEENTLL